MGLVCFLNSSADNFHRAVQEVVLLGPRLRKHAYCCWEPSFRECAELTAAFPVHVDLILEKLQHLDLGLLRFRIEAEAFCISLEGILVRSHEGDCVRVLAVVEEGAVDVFRALDEVFLDSFRRVFLAVCSDEEGLEASYHIEHLFVAHVAHVACVEPAVHDCVGCRLRVLPVACHHVFSLDADLSLRAEWLLYAVCVEDLDLHRLDNLS